MTQIKIIFTGPLGTGKSTAIQSISDITPVQTEVFSKEVNQPKKKSTTTLAMDYGVVDLDGNEKIHLYGTPSLERLDFVWDILVKGGIGLVLLLDNTRADPFKDMWFFLEAFKKFITASNVVIGITKMDISNKPTIDDYYTQLQVSNLNPPIFAVDARAKNDVSIILQALLYSLDPGLTE